MKQIITVTSPQSGSGKTMFTLWLLAQAQKRGLVTQAVKLGPDYLDPNILDSASDYPVLNLDPWAMSESTQLSILNLASKRSDLVVIEAMMGLYDGAYDNSGSPADFIRKWNIPWLMIASAAGVGSSLAYMIYGLITKMAPPCSGIILNRVANDAHASMIINPLKKLENCPQVLTYFARDKAWTWPHRYLGLRQARQQDHVSFKKSLAASKPLMTTADNILDALPKNYRLIENTAKGQNQESNSISSIKQDSATASFLPAPGKHIAVARDQAFSFIYEAQLEYWSRHKTKLSFFSPLADESVPEDCDAIYLPGGYPERYLKRLTSNAKTRQSITNAASRNVIIFGECGGAAMLGQSIRDQSGLLHDCWDLIPLHVDYAKQNRKLGYRQVHVIKHSWLGPAGTIFRGHQFHYGDIMPLSSPNALPLWQSYDSRGNLIADEGWHLNNVFATFVHVIDRV